MISLDIGCQDRYELGFNANLIPQQKCSQLGWKGAQEAMKYIRSKCSKIPMEIALGI